MPLPKANPAHLIIMAFVCVAVLVGLFVYSRIRVMPLPNVITQQPAPVPLNPEPLPLARWQAESGALPVVILSLAGDVLTYRVDNEIAPKTANMRESTQVYSRVIRSDFSYEDEITSTSDIQTNRPAFLVLSGQSVEAVYLIVN